MNKTKASITRADFRESAQAIKVIINDIPMMAEVKEFSTGSLGWYLNGKTTIDIGGKPVSVQIGMNLTIVGSKDLPKDEPSKPSAKEGEQEHVAAQLAAAIKDRPSAMTAKGGEQE
ncbi:MAG: hypothetical protein M3X11_25090 [Acidobacteriota bacterium]|nr:hypothetical protein [Acidobacteriota bacterium]